MSNKRRRGDSVDSLILLANDSKFVAAVAELQGKRPSMEDSHINSKLNGSREVRIFGVCDGHGGSNCSKFLKENLAKFISSELSGIEISKPESVKSAITIAFQKCEAEFEKLNEEDSSGSTCCLLLYFEDLNLFYIANCGDSRAIIFSDISSQANQGKLITTDHKPDLPSEKSRIEALGGSIYSIAYQRFGVTQYIHRVNGILAVARSFGDKQLRPYLTEVPDILGPFPVTNKTNSAVLLACDGAFECNSSEELCANISDIVLKCSQQELRMTRQREKIGVEARRALAVANGVLRFSFGKGSEDNITAIFIQFLSQ